MLPAILENLYSSKLVKFIMLSSCTEEELKEEATKIS